MGGDFILTLGFIVMWDGLVIIGKLGGNVGRILDKGIVKVIDLVFKFCLVIFD